MKTMSEFTKSDRQTIKDMIDYYKEAGAKVPPRLTAFINNDESYINEFDAHTDAFNARNLTKTVLFFEQIEWDIVCFESGDLLK